MTTPFFAFLMLVCSISAFAGPQEKFIDAVICGDINEVTAILETARTTSYWFYPDVHVNRANERNHTALHVAADCGHTEIAQLLLEHGADPNLKDNFGHTALHWAADYYGHTEIAQLLLEHGADPNLKDNRGYTALHLAATCGHTETAQLLLEHGADPNLGNLDEMTHGCTVDLELALTPLHLADLKGDTECAKLLINYGAGADWEPSERRFKRLTQPVKEILLHAQTTATEIPVLK